MTKSIGPHEQEVGFSRYLVHYERVELTNGFNGIPTSSHERGANEAEQTSTLAVEYDG